MAGWNMDGVGLLPQNMHHQIELEWRMRERKKKQCNRTNVANEQTNERTKKWQLESISKME